MTDLMKMEQEARKANATELSKAAAALLKAEPEAEKNQLLVLENAILTAARQQEEDLTEQDNNRYPIYLLKETQDLIEGLTWWQRSPAQRYRLMTENRNLDEEENREEMAYLLEITQSKDPEEWVLGSLVTELIENLTSWFDLKPEFPELLPE